MSLFTRIQRASRAFQRNPVDLDKLSHDIDNLIEAKQLATMDTVEKQGKNFQRDIVNTDSDMAAAYVPFYGMLRDWARGSSVAAKNWYKKEPHKDDPTRDEYLSTIWQHEPILAGAVYSMTAKMMSLKWNISGKRKEAVNYAKLLARASHMGGFDWGGFISGTAEDFYTTNRGVFWELAKGGDPSFARMEDIGHIDALTCTLTGNSKFPVEYNGYITGQRIRFQPGEFIHFCSMQSPRERNLGVGFCAVDRALRSAKLLMGLHDYDDEKLDNLPPEGVAAISGMTMAEFQDAVTLWKAKRTQDNSLTFPQVLWLIGSDPSANIGVNFSAFSQLPESFDRQTVVEQYVNTVALATGVDAREFWTFTGGGLGGSSAGESEIQHLKAKGKGPGEFISTAERHINGELPEETDFEFDTQDIEEDASSAAVAKAWIDAFFPLYNLPPGSEVPNEAANSKNMEQKAQGNPRPDKPNGSPSLPTPMLPKIDTGNPMSSQSGGQNMQAEQVISRDQFMRLLADKGVLPDWMVTDDRVMIEDTDIHNQGFKSIGHDDDDACIVWEKGLLKEVRVKGTIVINSPKVSIIDVPIAQLEDKPLSITDYSGAYEYLKQKKTDILSDNKNIHGEPIPESEALRGSKPNRKTIHDELELWRSNPILSPYAMTVEEEIAKFGVL